MTDIDSADPRDFTPVAAVHEIAGARVVRVSETYRVANLLGDDGEVIEGADGVAVADGRIPRLCKVLTLEISTGFRRISGPKPSILA